MTGERKCNDFTMNKTRSNRIKRYIQGINPNDYLEYKAQITKYYIQRKQARNKKNKTHGTKQ